MGVLLDPLQRIASTLSRCVHVARWFGFDGATPEQIADRIYLDGIGSDVAGSETMSAEQQQSLRPYIVIYPSSEAGYHFSRNAAPNCFAAKGTAIVVLSKGFDSALSPSEFFRQCAEQIELIVSCDDPDEPGLLEMAQFAGNIAIDELSVYFEGRTPEESKLDYGDAYDVVLVLEYR